MHWLDIVGLAVAPVLVVAVVLIALRAAAPGAGGHGAGGHGAGWRFRCTKCGRTRDAGEAGAVRVGAFSVRKVVLGHCGGCRRLRLLALERKPHDESPAPAPARPPA